MLGGAAVGSSQAGPGAKRVAGGLGQTLLGSGSVSGRVATLPAQREAAVAARADRRDQVSRSTEEMHHVPDVRTRYPRARSAASAAAGGQDADTLSAQRSKRKERRLRRRHDADRPTGVSAGRWNTGGTTLLGG